MLCPILSTAPEQLYFEEWGRLNYDQWSINYGVKLLGFKFFCALYDPRKLSHSFL